MKIPETMWPAPPQLAGTQDEMLAVYDARTGISALTLVVSIIPASHTLTVGAMRRNFGAVLKQRLHLKRDLVWQDFPAQPSRTLSRFFAASAAMAQAGYPAVNAYGLVRLSEKEWGLLTFAVTGQDTAATSLYAAAMRQMMSSVTLRSTHK